MNDIPPGSFHQGYADDRHGRFRVRLFRSQYEPARYVLKGDAGTCGATQGWAAGDRLLTQEGRKMSGLPPATPLAEFEVRLIERMEFKDRPLGGEFQMPDVITLDPPLAVKFTGVRWLSSGCSAPDSLCGGRVEFAADGVEISPAHDPCDEPVMVTPRSPGKMI